MRLKITNTMSITVVVSKRASQPYIQKKEVMKDGVSSPDTKKMCVYLQMIQKKMMWGDTIYIRAGGDRQRPIIIEGPSNGRPEKTLR